MDCDPNGFCFDHNSVNEALFAGGLGTLIGSVVVSAILGTVQDRAEISVTPLRLSSAPGFTSVALDRGIAQGASVSVRF